MASFHQPMSRVSVWARCRPALAWLLLLCPLLLAACFRQGGGGPGATRNELSAVVALTSNNVWAVEGMSTPDNGGPQVLIEHWDGVRWRSAMPDLAGELCSISASSASDIWAVGASWYCSNGSDALLLTLHWDGQQWQQIPVTLPDSSPGALGRFNAVAALAPDNAWAVGSCSIPTYSMEQEYPGDLQRSPTSTGEPAFCERQGLIEHWDGQRWNMVPQPYTGQSSTLQAIAAFSARDVWAVGFGKDAVGSGVSVAEHWNGQSWTMIPMPGYTQHLFGDLYLNGLSASSPGHLWAVGTTDYAPAPLLIEHWDGTTWQAMPGLRPFQPSQNKGEGLQAIAAVNDQDVWAVGDVWTGSTNRYEDLLILHWDGYAWQQAAAPSFQFGSQLSALAAFSAGDIWAVGSTISNNNSGTRTLIEHWDGHSWQAVPSPNPGKPGPPVGSA